ncbi:hypothetical protein CK936_00105 [Streptomyces albireticuli]|uniref:Uncharacterized protein n=1 Tax=Streptomyces albireticuli TaxID=1940 RepID=A0A2A2DEI4_9ACTN|nr:hypothetical protein CK936_00105 [Streptomyces albireticuli]
MIKVLLAADGRGWVDGIEVPSEDSTLAGTRAAALRQIARAAAEQRRSLRVEATDPDGAVWLLVVHPSGRVQDATEVRELVADPDGETTPAEYRERVVAVVRAVEAGTEHAAMRLARFLETGIAGAYGAGHPYVWRALELRAHTNLVCGLPGSACELYLEAARGWAGIGSAAYWGAAQRAYACWHRVREAERSVWLGGQLAEVLRLGGDRAHPALRGVMGRMDDLQGGLVA